MDTDYTSAIYSGDKEVALKAFLFNYNDSFENLEYVLSNDHSLSDKMIDCLQSYSLSEIIDFIDENEDCIGSIDPTNIPQFSDIEFVNAILSIVKTNPNGNFELFGYYYKKDASEGAHRKYGENHYKMAAHLGLTTHQRPFKLTCLGESYLKLSSKDKLIIRPKLSLRIPLIQMIMINSLYGNAYPAELMRKCLSESTVMRRRSNVRGLVKEICDSLEDGSTYFDRIIWD